MIIKKLEYYAQILLTISTDGDGYNDNLILNPTKKNTASMSVAVV